MALFLTSQASQVLDHVCTKLSKPPPEYTVTFIPTASNPYTNPTWIEEDRAKLKTLGFRAVELDLEGKTHEELEESLSDTHIVFVAGGNTFFLMEKVRESGFDLLLPKLIAKGVSYIGSSAGSVILAPDIEPSKFFDERKNAHLTDMNGLGLIDFYPLPHAGKEKYAEVFNQVMNEYKDWSYQVVPVTDTQYFYITDESEELIDVARV